MWVLETEPMPSACQSLYEQGHLLGPSLNIVDIHVLAKGVSSFCHCQNNSGIFFVDKTNNTQIQMESQKSTMATSILWGKLKAGHTTPSDVRTYVRSAVMKNNMVLKQKHSYIR